MYNIRGYKQRRIAYDVLKKDAAYTERISDYKKIKKTI